jgi:hypothetical protein
VELFDLMIWMLGDASSEMSEEPFALSITAQRREGLKIPDKHKAVPGSRESDVQPANIL